MSVSDLTRQLVIAQQTFCRWKSRYAGLQSEQPRQPKQVQEATNRLTRLPAELSLDMVMLQDVLSRSSRTLAAAQRRKGPEAGG
jgi:putative transposase